MTRYILPRAYPLSRSYHESYLKRLNSKNITIQGLQILSGDELQVDETNLEQLNEHPFFRDLIKTLNGSNYRISGIRTTSSPPFNDDAPVFQNSDDDDDDFAENLQRNGFRGFGFIGNNRNNRGKKSDNYEVVYDHNMNFNSVGGYDKIKKELQQCVDILSNYTKYTKYNVRIPRGLILEGPPGNGKTLLAKAFAGEAGLGFISVSGSGISRKICRRRCFQNSGTLFSS